MSSLIGLPLVRGVLSNAAKELNEIKSKTTGTVTTSSGDFTSRNGSFATPDTINNLVGTLTSGVALMSPDSRLNAVGQAGTAKAVSDLVSSSSSAASLPSFPSSASSVVSYPSDAGTSVVLPDYLNADLAKAYGMDAATAYQEALSNTSYQRAVADLRAAGLNPALISGNFSGASSNVYGASLASNGISTGVSSAAGAHDWYKQLSNIGGLLGAGAALLTGSGIRGAYFGSKVGSVAGGAIGNLFDLNR